MKIPRPKPPETSFKRTRTPPPQATRLLLTSLAAGLIFMAVLAIVFIPRYLEYANPPTVEIVQLDALPGGRLNVTGSSAVLSLSDFNATLSRDNVTIASLGAGLTGGGPTLRFTDANGNGQLDPGDYFTVGASVQGSYRFEVWQVNVGKLVGLYTWEGVLS